MVYLRTSNNQFRAVGPRQMPPAMKPTGRGKGPGGSGPSGRQWGSLLSSKGVEGHGRLADHPLQTHPYAPCDCVWKLPGSQNPNAWTDVELDARWFIVQPIVKGRHFNLVGGAALHEPPAKARVLDLCTGPTPARPSRRSSIHWRTYTGPDPMPSRIPPLRCSGKPVGEVKVGVEFPSSVVREGDELTTWTAPSRR
jgi:hypothetical protein